MLGKNLLFAVLDWNHALIVLVLNSEQGKWIRVVDFAGLLDAARVSKRQASALFKVGDTTVRRWIKGEQRPSHAVVVVLQIMAYGLEFIPGAGAAWSGWRLQDGELHDGAESHTPAQIRAWQYVAGLLQAHRARENQVNADLPDNALLHPTANKAHDLTEALHKLLNGKKS